MLHFFWTALYYLCYLFFYAILFILKKSSNRHDYTCMKQKQALGITALFLMPFTHFVNFCEWQHWNHHSCIESAIIDRSFRGSQTWPAEPFGLTWSDVSPRRPDLIASKTSIDRWAYNRAFDAAVVIRKQTELWWLHWKFRRSIAYWLSCKVLLSDTSY